MAVRHHSTMQGYSFVLLAACLWATIGLFYRAIIGGYGLSQNAVVAFRTGLAALLLLLGLLLTRREALRLPWHEVPFFLVFGSVGVAGFFLAYMQAITRGTIAQAAILLYTAPIWIMLWSALHDGERLERRRLLALGLAIVGCVLVAQAYDPARLRLNAPAVIYGLLSGMGYAAYSIWSGIGTRRGHDPWTVVLYALGIGALVLFAFTPSGETLQVLRTPASWPLLIGVAVVTSLLGQVVFTFGLRSIRTSTASILATIEPVVAAGLAWGLLGEALVWQQIAGGACVLLAVIILLRQPIRVEAHAIAGPETSVTQRTVDDPLHG